MRAVGERQRNHYLCILGEFPGRVDGGSEGSNFEFMCVGKEVCTVLFSVNMFQGFTLLF